MKARVRKKGLPLSANLCMNNIASMEAKIQRKGITSEGLVRMKQQSTGAAYGREQVKSKGVPAFHWVFGHGCVQPRSKQTWVALFYRLQCYKLVGVATSGVIAVFLLVSPSLPVLPRPSPFLALL